MTTGYPMQRRRKHSEELKREAVDSQLPVQGIRRGAHDATNSISCATNSSCSARSDGISKRDAISQKLILLKKI